MREIKFRAWHKKYRWFGQVVWLDIPHNNTENPKLGVVTKDIPPDGWDADEFELKEAILMQYTGLKDKNGVEIYEGDIITGMMYPNKAEVMFDERFATFKAQRGTQLIQLGYECEVIGNIYENPELLGGTDNE